MSELIFIIENSERIKGIDNYFLTMINNILNIQSVLYPKIITSIICVNESINYLHFRKNINDIDKILLEHLNPSGSFKMYDNISPILHRLKSFQDKTNSKSPIVIVLTYDTDNSSVRLNERLFWLQTTINRGYGWKFIFLTCTEESFNIGKNIGFDCCIQYGLESSHLEHIIHVFEYLNINNFTEKFILSLKGIS
jgi:hypothetical protein